jgi:CYTH domain-containing protein
MNQEIERKFLLKTLPPDLGRREGASIEQGYLAVEPHGFQVRLRKKGETAFLTVKGEPNGYARQETEVELSSAQFETLWPLTAGRRLRKTRYEIPFEKWTVEIDVYGGCNQGLVVAEVEFESEEEAHRFAPPGWFAQDVSGEAAYSNRNLARE